LQFIEDDTHRFAGLNKVPLRSKTNNRSAQSPKGAYRHSKNINAIGINKKILDFDFNRQTEKTEYVESNKIVDFFDSIEEEEIEPEFKFDKVFKHEMLKTTDQINNNDSIYLGNASEMEEMNRTYDSSFFKTPRSRLNTLVTKSKSKTKDNGTISSNRNNVEIPNIKIPAIHMNTQSLVTESPSNLS